MTNETCKIHMTNDNNDLDNTMVEILIVDDSPMHTTILKDFLEQHNFAVLTAGNGVEALALIRVHEPAMVISDIVMPEMDGYQLCREIKKDPKIRHLPIIILTVLTGPLDLIKVLECEADFFITKPFEEDMILSRIQYILANKHLMDKDNPNLGVKINFAGERYSIKSDRIQILNLLLSAYEAAIRNNGELSKVQKELKTLNEQLELKIESRTAALHESEERYRQAQKMEAIGQLAGGVAHDFNNILSTISGYSHLILDQVKENDTVNNYIEEILEASKRAAVLTQSLLTFSRKQTVNLAVIDLGRVMAGFESFIRRLIRENIEIQIHCAGEPLVVLADRGQIEQVIMNLVTNARDAMPDGGTLILETRPITLDQKFIETHGFGKAGAYAQITVSDSGEGMDKEVQSHIFEPFFTTKEQGKGTGLGLSMAYGIVKKHDGFINVYSEPGKGTAFTIYLPRVQDIGKVVKMETREVAPLRGGSETILIGEDDAALLRLTTRVLSHHGYRVIQAVDGQDAVDKFVEYGDSIHLVILDAIMPKKTGKVAFDEIKMLRPDLKVIFTSGYARNTIEENYTFDEHTDFIHKPLSPDELVAKVREMLDKSE